MNIDENCGSQGASRHRADSQVSLNLLVCPIPIISTLLYLILLAPGPRN